MRTRIVVRSKIRFNGHEYASVEEMPAAVRNTYERAIASLSTQAGGDPISRHAALTPPGGAATTEVEFNGQRFSSVDQMPAEVRRMYEGIMAAVDADHNGIPDVLERGGSPVNPAPVQHPQGSVSLSLGASPGGAIQTETSGSRLVLVGVALALGWLAWSLLAR